MHIKLYQIDVCYMYTSIRISKFSYMGYTPVAFLIYTRYVRDKNNTKHDVCLYYALCIYIAYFITYVTYSPGYYYLWNILKSVGIQALPNAHVSCSIYVRV